MTQDLLNTFENPDMGEPTVESPQRGKAATVFSNLFTFAERGASILRDIQGNDPVENRNTVAQQPNTQQKPPNWFLIAGIAAAVLALVFILKRR